MDYGTEKTTTDLDEVGSTMTVIRKVRAREVATTYKQYKVRIKVKDQKDQMVEYMKHADKVSELHKAGKLVIKDDDQSLYPCLVSEFPKHNIDGSWFIISSWTELV